MKTKTNKRARPAHKLKILVSKEVRIEKPVTCSKPEEALNEELSYNRKINVRTA